MRTTHQRVIVTRSQWWWSTRGGNDENDAPTSHRDSLVVLAVDAGWIVLYTISKMTQRNMKKKKTYSIIDIIRTNESATVSTAQSHGRVSAKVCQCLLLV